ncbi:MAG: hypothetical protein ACSW8I_06605, partial [bacterium]
LMLGNDTTLYFGADSMYSVDLKRLVNHTLPWDSVTAKPDTLMLGNDTTLYFGADSMYSVDLKRLVNHTLPWDSITGAPSTIEWDSVTNKPTTIAWDSITGKPTTIKWDSITNAPTKLSQFNNNITIAWDSITGKPTTIAWDSVSGRPTKLSQFNNDLHLNPNLTNDKLCIPVTQDTVDLSTLHTLWTNVRFRPTSLRGFRNDLDLTFYHDTLFLGGTDSTLWVDLRPLRNNPVSWQDISSRPANLSYFFNDLHLSPSLQNDTLFFLFPTATDTVDLKPLRVTSLPWESITGRPTKLSDPKLTDDLANVKIHDTLFLHNHKDTILLHRSSLYTHWDSILARPAWVDTAHYVGTTPAALHIHNVVTPLLSNDAANKHYVDSLLALRDARIDSLRNVIDSLDSVLLSVQHPSIEGQLDGYFTVNNSGKKILFSKGNLQYHPQMNVFRFAEHQYDIVGEENNNASLKNIGNKWLDLFGYGTSTWDGGREKKMPYDASTTDQDFMVDIVNGNPLTGMYANADWGRYNTIVNGSNQHSQWRTLTKDEWDYILFYRANYANLRTMATVNGVGGLILLPDSWQCPTGVNLTVNQTLPAGDNIFNLADWEALEAAGAVFLPMAGIRQGYVTSIDGSFGYYWTATNATNTKSFTVNIRSDQVVGFMNMECSRACSVRLVRDY